MIIFHVEGLNPTNPNARGWSMIMDFDQVTAYLKDCVQPVRLTPVTKCEKCSLYYSAVDKPNHTCPP